MCKTYNKIGSLSTLKSRLKESNIHNFNSLKEVMDFQSSYPSLRQQIIAEHEKLIVQELNPLLLDLEQLIISIETQKRETTERLSAEIDHLNQQLSRATAPINLIQKLVKPFKVWNYKKQLRLKAQEVDGEVTKSVKNLVHLHQEKNSRYQFITSQFDDAVKESAQTALLEIDRKKSVIDSLNNYIHGAIGENKVVRTLETLSDDYYLINDFTINFHPAIHNRQENDYIKSIQIDHLLVAPSGIFLIETKNWSEKSLENLSLRSPVEQIRRSYFALYKLLNHDMSNSFLGLRKHHWGDRKISVRNLIVLMHTKPMEEFQHVKIVTLNEILGYINYFKPTFSSIETQRIAEFLLDINEQKTIFTR